MRGGPAIGVDDDLAAGEAGIAIGTADDELAGRVDVPDGLLVTQPSGRERSTKGSMMRLTSAEVSLASRCWVDTTIWVTPTG